MHAEATTIEQHNAAVTEAQKAKFELSIDMPRSIGMIPTELFPRQSSST